MANNPRNTLKILFVFFPGLAYVAQTDTTNLHEVVITAYLQDRPVLRLPASVALIDSAQIGKQPGQSLVPVLNTVPGVRMEERSPGSYRLSIRGSLIRSPFGIRNTKIYIDEFPLTNAGGEAYLNVIDVNSIHSLEILKGPDGSLFGANSGGVVRIQPDDLKNNRPRVMIGTGAGSYGLFQQNIGLHHNLGKNKLSLYESWQRSDSYRQNSAMDRKFIRLSDRLDYSDKGQLRFLFFYSDLDYRTPGGLTLGQFSENAQQARPATRTLPGAAEQKAGIHNNTLYGGILHEFKITERTRHVIAVFGSKTLFENPFITNYEVRNENNGGARTWFEFKNKNTSGIQLTYNAGGEIQAMQSRINNYGNRSGTKDTVQAIDLVTISQGFAFTRLVADLYNKWIVEGSFSYNYNEFVFTRTSPVATPTNKKVFDPQLMPRLAVSYLVSDRFSLRAITSRGYSPPTLQEIRSSDNRVNTTLRPESGWNYEIGSRLMSKNGRVWWDVSAYYYRLEEAIVKQTNPAGQEYFVNAGGTLQPGLESQLTLQVVKPRKEKFIRGIIFSHAYTYQPFIFTSYSNETADFSGNSLTGVPQHVSVSGLSFNFPAGIYVFTQYTYTSRLPLNDGNTEYASEYHLIQLKAGWKFSGKSRFALDLSAGVDNLLDQSYSLGNDLNAIGGRYYNAAAPRNYFARLGLWF